MMPMPIATAEHREARYALNERSALIMMQGEHTAFILRRPEPGVFDLRIVHDDTMAVIVDSRCLSRDSAIRRAKAWFDSAAAHPHACTCGARFRSHMAARSHLATHRR